MAPGRLARSTLNTVGLVLAALALTVGTAAAARTTTTPGTRTLAYAPLELIDPDVHYASTNWAGYDVTWLNLEPERHLHTYVSARWIQPAVTCAPGENSAAAIWVGLDGDGNSVLEQTGSTAACVNGRAVYRGWRDFYPAAAVNFAEPIRPGDALVAIAQFHADTGNTVLTLTDSTQGWTHVGGAAAAPGATRQSAEVIVEAPTDPRTGALVPLADFGTVTFTLATVDGTALMHVKEDLPLAMQRPDGSPRAMISAIQPYNGFTVAWRNP